MAWVGSMASSRTRRPGPPRGPGTRRRRRTEATAHRSHGARSRPVLRPADHDRSGGAHGAHDRKTVLLVHSLDDSHDHAQSTDLPTTTGPVVPPEAMTPTPCC